MSGHRIIKGLQWAMLDNVGPGFAPKRARGAKRQGLKYERDFASAFGATPVAHGRWIKFCDANGLGFAQPDVVMPLGGDLIVFECKYTWVPEAHTQIELLYKPLLECLYPQARVSGVVACKVLTGWAKARHQIVRDMESAIEIASRAAGAPVLHWIGSGPLWRSRSVSRTLEELGL